MSALEPPRRRRRAVCLDRFVSARYDDRRLPQVIVFTIHGQIEGKAMNIIDDGAAKVEIGFAIVPVGLPFVRLPLEFSS